MEKTKLLELDEEQIAILREHAEKKRKELMAQLAMEEAKLSKLSETTKQQTSIPFIPEGYKKSMSLPAKIIFIIKGFGKCVTARDIFNKLVEYEPNIKANKTLALSMVTSISSAIYTRVVKEKKDLNRYKVNDDSDYKVGLAEWFNPDGSPKEQYRNDD